MFLRVQEADGDTSLEANFGFFAFTGDSLITVALLFKIWRYLNLNESVTK
jgi:hypothetical protein